MRRSRLSRGHRKLPVVYIDGKKFYRDDRLREYREVSNPYHVIRFPYRLGDR